MRALRTSKDSRGRAARRAAAYTSEMGRITVPFSDLVIYHREIGTHGGRGAGFRDVFDFRNLRDLPFVKLAVEVRQAYEAKKIPSHGGWPAQREALRWFVEQGRDAILAINRDEPIKIRPSPYQQYYIDDGHHRALALFILGDREIRATKIRS